MKRAAAVAAAVVMIAVALLVRSMGDTTDEPGTTAAPGGSTGDALVICVQEIQDACLGAGLGDGRGPTAGELADTLLAPDRVDGLDGLAWVLPAPWARLVIDERARLGRPALFSIAGDPLASTEVVDAIWSDRFDELAARCGEVTWRCVAEQSVTRLAAGDRVRAAIPNVDSATGLAVAAAQAAGLLGTADFAANDFDGSFRSLASSLANGQTATPLSIMRSRGPGEVTVASVAATDAQRQNSNFGTIRLVELGPPARIDLVVLGVTGRDLDASDRQRLTETLLAAGWTAGGTGPDGMPSGGVLAAVRTLWSEGR